jgi:hypothetical protein
MLMSRMWSRNAWHKLYGTQAVMQRGQRTANCVTQRTLRRTTDAATCVTQHKPHSARGPEHMQWMPRRNWPHGRATHMAQCSERNACPMYTQSHALCHIRRVVYRTLRCARCVACHAVCTSLIAPRSVYRRLPGVFHSIVQGCATCADPMYVTQPRIAPNVTHRLRRVWFATNVAPVPVVRHHGRNWSPTRVSSIGCVFNVPCLRHRRV